MIFLQDLWPLLVLICLFVFLLSIQLFLKAHGATDADLSQLRNIDSVLGLGIVSYLGYIFYKGAKGPPKE